MQGIEFQRLLEGVDSGGIILLLAVEGGKKIVRIGIAGVDLQDLLKVGNGLGSLSFAAMYEPEVVPGARVSGILGGGLLQRFRGFGQLLFAEQSNPLVQYGCGQCRVEFVCRIELGDRFFHQLLVHHGDAEVIQLRRFCPGLG